MKEISIPFNKSTQVGNEIAYIKEALLSNKLCGDNLFSKKCQKWFLEKGFQNPLMTPSCTAALEMTGILMGIEKGDEIIMPSYTFVSTANAFVLRGAKIVFVDIKASDMNIDENKIEAAITHKTRAIVVVHYGGVPCEMDKIKSISNKYNLFLIEDAAQALMSTYKNKMIGTFGDFACFSFHQTKNFTSAGEGGLITINNETFAKRAEIIREKGTNRTAFTRKEISKYSWIDIGSSYLPSDIQCAYLFAQLEKSEAINEKRKSIWNKYYSGLKELANKDLINLAKTGDHINHNAHLFFIKLKDINQRNKLIEYLNNYDIEVVFHYLPLHNSEAGKRFGTFSGEDQNTTMESNRLIRLPLFYSLQDNQICKIIQKIKDFF